GPTSCHELRSSTLMLIIRAFMAWELNGDTRDVHILHPSASRAEHTPGLHGTSANASLSTSVSPVLIAILGRTLFQQFSFYLDVIWTTTVFFFHS
ncbi:hypothetical protein K439DRAFT_1643247, partial [Ramaria rubella]